MSSEQSIELPRSLEDRVARIEKWIDFWETIETGWNARANVRESITQLIAECRGALSAGLPYMEGASFSSQYARDQVKRTITACEIALSKIEDQEGV